LQNRELSRKTARNALLPSLNLYGAYAGTGAAGTRIPHIRDRDSNLPDSYGGALKSALDNTAPEYRVGFQLSVPLRNRIAKADQARTELEYRQSQVIWRSRRSGYASRCATRAMLWNKGPAALRRPARPRLAQRTMDIMQKEQKLALDRISRRWRPEHDMALAESALVTAETLTRRARIEVRRATGSILEGYGIRSPTPKPARWRWVISNKEEPIRVWLPTISPHS